MFRPLQPTTVRWRPLEGEGLEHLTLMPRNGPQPGIRITSVVIGARAGIPYGVRYTIDCDPHWTTTALTLSTTTGLHLSLVSDGLGHWQDGDGQALPAFDGCIDVDLAGTPFTNTLPIRRLSLRPEDGTRSLDMLYIPFDTFEPLRDGQHYTCLTQDRLYRYEAADRSFTAELPLDADGLVLDYPTLFIRT
ncbi:transcriptional regulator [Rhizobium sp. Leaf371]|uniref:putative glycolipid-binding domain-containing protein n=1 Tax=Rhizobium sp. Leaf371 TaxID=1736355 RepID=UPI000712F57A|nr:putative glycolipid-binding domain-containing protein [Rhizobium sp. Leaf371]KQS64578.1 transcriptional regulator [Rhizobium sp. Leaf371]